MNMVKILFINSSHSYRLDLPYALNCRGLRTQLQTTRLLCTQHQSLLLLYDPKTQLTLRLNPLDTSCFYSIP